MDELAASKATGIVERVLRAALAGDMAAIALVLPRLWPIRRGRPVKVALPPIRTAADALDGHAALVSAVASGTLTAEEAQAIGNVLLGALKAIEISDLERRLSALEQARDEEDER